LAPEFDSLEFNKICEKIASCAVSEPGKELALQIKPELDHPTLLKKFNQVTELRDILEYDQFPPVDGIRDLRPLVKKARLAAGMLGTAELAWIVQNLTIVRRLQQFFAGRIEKIPNLKAITSELRALPATEKEINRCIDCDSNLVKDEASPELAAIRSQINHAQATVRRKIESKLKQFSEQGYLQENVVSIRDGRFVLIVKDEYKRKIKGLIHGQSSSGSSFFIEPVDVFEDNNHIRELQTRELREVEKVLMRLSDLVRKDIVAIEHNIVVLADLDLVFAKAVFAKMINGHQPEITTDNSIALYSGRHPLLVLRMGEKNVVPLDVELGDKIYTLIISGPNAGGKTVALKTIGLLTLMARCGLHIPALPHSRIGDIRQIFVSIGDQQSIDNDLSTFSSHIKTLADIARHADSATLALVDEIGAATDPEEGTALAMSLLENLTIKKCLSVVTTHLGALKAFAFQNPGIENASLEFNAETLQATYHFRTGIPGSSYAFDIAQRMGYPPDLITRARTLVGSHKDKLEGLILDLEDKIVRYQELNTELNIRQSGLESLQKLYAERSEALKRDEKKIKSQAVKEAEQIISQANSLVEKTIKEIREKQARREAIINAKTVINEQKETIKVIKKQVQEPKPAAPLTTLAIGDYVRWKDNTTIGQVISEIDKKGSVYIQLDGVKIKAPVAELERAGKKQHKSVSVIKVNMEEKPVITNEIDLRGMRVEEARESVDRFIDESILCGMKEIRIIHGKGTGALRKDLTEFLKNHQQVSQFRLGYWNEGNTGVTVVELKAK